MRQKGFHEPVELHRVFPPASRTEDDTTAVPLHAPSDAATDILVDELRAIIRASERCEEDLRQERDRWRTASRIRNGCYHPRCTRAHQGLPQRFGAICPGRSVGAGCARRGEA